MQQNKLSMSQTSFGHISINLILMVSTAMKSPQKDLFIDASYVSRKSIMAEILGRSTDNLSVNQLLSWNKANCSFISI